MSPKILIVDDSDTTLLMEEMLLKKQNFQVVKAHNGKEAVEMAIRELPNLILMDVVMPIMDGFAACREMRRHEKLQSVPIIMVSSRGEPQSIESGFESGCNDYLTKPIQSHEFLQIVDSYLAAEKAK